MKVNATISKVNLTGKNASTFIQMTNEFHSTIWMEKNETRINAKSLLGTLSLLILAGDRITLVVDGPDEEKAISDIIRFLESK